MSLCDAMCHLKYLNPLTKVEPVDMESEELPHSGGPRLGTHRASEGCWQGPEQSTGERGPASATPENPRKSYFHLFIDYF